MPHLFPDLPYAYDALEPYIDTKTMEVHYSKHHRTYYDKFLSAIKGTEHEDRPLSEIFARVSTLPAAVRNHGGGYYNHIVYWNCMKPNAGGEPQGELAAEIERQFGSFAQFKEAFSSRFLPLMCGNTLTTFATKTAALSTLMRGGMW